MSWKHGGGSTAEAQKTTSSISTSMLQVRKEKLGERITVLQQLISPFGKTDTTSVLLEAIGYLQEQAEVLFYPIITSELLSSTDHVWSINYQVLSTPYMKPSINPSSLRHDDMGKFCSSKSKSHDLRQDLRSRGLCLVSVSCTLQVADDNGADFQTSNRRKLPGKEAQLCNRFSRLSFAQLSLVG